MLFYLNTVFRILLNVKTWFILSENSFEKNMFGKNTIKTCFIISVNRM